MDEEEIDFRQEAQGVIKDISFAVDHIQVSNRLPSTLECAYLNIQTKEKDSYCVQLCVQGFRVGFMHYMYICLKITWFCMSNDLKFVSSYITCINLKKIYKFVSEKKNIFKFLIESNDFVVLIMK